MARSLSFCRESIIFLIFHDILAEKGRGKELFMLFRIFLEEKLCL